MQPDLQLRIHPELIDGALVHIAGELEKNQQLRDQLNVLRRTARAADREAAKLVEQWGDTGPLHQQVHEIISAARLVVNAINERIAVLVKEPNK